MLLKKGLWDQVVLAVNSAFNPAEDEWLEAAEDEEKKKKKEGDTPGAPAPDSDNG